MSEIRYDLINSVWEEASLKARLNDDFCKKSIEEWREDQFRFAKENTTLTPIETQYLLDELVKVREAVDAKTKRGETFVCSICERPKYSEMYCEHCIRSKLNKERWTSGNQKLDAFIRKCQDESPVPHCIVEWIEFSDLKDVRFLAEGGFGKVYSAMWTRGLITDWNMTKKEFVRQPRKVVLKTFDDCLPGDELFQEAHWNQVFNRNRTIRIFVVIGFGFSRNHEGKYMIVLDYCEGGDLRDYLQEHYKTMSWKDKVKISWDISTDVWRIAETGSVHGDLHPGNILLNNSCWLVSDFGTCGPVDVPKKQVGRVKGVLPYMAPELLCGGQKTPKSDIYALGIIMWTISTGCIPFSDQYGDPYLAGNILRGLRPPIMPGTPEKYVDLMRKCWADNPYDRISASDAAQALKELLRSMIENDFIDEYSTEHNQPWNKPKLDTTAFRTSELIKKENWDSDCWNEYHSNEVFK